MEIGDIVKIIPLYMKKICMEYAPHRSKENLNNTQIKVLMALGSHEGISLKILSEMISIDQGALSRIINVLFEKRIIKRETSKIDRRVVLIYLDNEGVDIYKENLQKLNEHINKMFSKLSNKENDEIIHALEILKKYSERI